MKYPFDKKYIKEFVMDESELYAHYHEFKDFFNQGLESIVVYSRVPKTKKDYLRVKKLTYTGFFDNEQIGFSSQTQITISEKKIEIELLSQQKVTSPLSRSRMIITKRHEGVDLFNKFFF